MRTWIIRATTARLDARRRTREAAAAHATAAVASTSDAAGLPMPPPVGEPTRTPRQEAFDHGDDLLPVIVGEPAMHREVRIIPAPVGHR